MKKALSSDHGDVERRLHRALGDRSRARILAELQEAGGPLDAHELAERIGLHANTVRSHLRVLAEAELVSARTEPRARPGRPRVVYEALTDTRAPSAAEGYRLLAQILASSLAADEEDAGTRAEEAGRAWGRFLSERPAPLARTTAADAVSNVVGLLDELGFQPRLQPDAQGHKVLMRHCPFRDVAAAYEGVVCQVHLGLVRGALDEAGVSVGADWLEPHVEPHLCVVHLVDSGEA